MAKTRVSDLKDGTIRLWDVTTGSACGTLEGYWSWARAMAFSPDGQLMVSGSKKGMLINWDTTTESPLSRFTSRSGAIKAAAFSQDDQLIALNSKDNTIKLRNV